MGTNYHTEKAVLFKFKAFGSQPLPDILLNPGLSVVPITATPDLLHRTLFIVIMIRKTHEIQVLFAPIAFTLQLATAGSRFLISYFRLRTGLPDFFQGKSFNLCPIATE
jgi:hypothetical protein